MTKLFPLAVLALALGGCASGRCDGDSRYREAESIAPIQGTGELLLPESPAALRVPPLSEAARTAAAQPVDNGGGRRKACLDVPPRLPPVEPEPAPATPPPAAPTAQ
ncbi:MAG: hypothetical protein Q8Q73_14260 [Stagnimonas sp.]|nr:hypothetical protein [Stagnimonas sp.]